MSHLVHKVRRETRRKADASLGCLSHLVRRKGASYVGVGLGFRPVRAAMNDETGIGTKLKPIGRLADDKALPLSVRRTRKEMPYAITSGRALRVEPLDRTIAGGREKAANKDDGQSAYWLKKAGLWPAKKDGNGGTVEAEGMGAGFALPISPRQAKDMAEFYYYGWLLRKNPGDSDVKARHMALRPRLAHAFMSLEGEEAAKARSLLADLKMIAFSCSQKIASERKRLDERLAGQAAYLESELSRLDWKEARELDGIAKNYEDKKKGLERIIGWKLMPMKDFMAKIAFPIAGAITAAATFTGWVKGLIADAPYVADIPQAAIGVSAGLALTALWAGIKGGKALLDWRLTVAGWKLARSQAEAETALGEKIALEKGDMARANKAASDHLARQFEDRHEAILEKFWEEYRNLALEHGYACPN
ncbi:Uncharacterised protein [uncultured archaeon]|nr:Uncharacterised protein [uncultured archaeon]